MTNDVPNARFMREPRFTMVDGEKIAVLLKPYLDGTYYEENFSKTPEDFYGEFSRLIRAGNRVLLARVDSDGDYHPEGIYSVLSPSFTDVFACNLGARICKVVEG